jgi:hypothetical protein
MVQPIFEGGNTRVHAGRVRMVGAVEQLKWPLYGAVGLLVGFIGCVVGATLTAILRVVVLTAVASNAPEGSAQENDVRLLIFHWSFTSFLGWRSLCQLIAEPLYAGGDGIFRRFLSCSVPVLKERFPFSMVSA